MKFDDLFFFVLFVFSPIRTPLWESTITGERHGRKSYTDPFEGYRLQDTDVRHREGDECLLGEGEY